MAVSSIAGTGTTTTTATTTATAAASAGSTTGANFDTFLKLLTTQLRNQDPMSPTDPTQFVAQLAQFSQVEQQAKTNTLLQQMTAAFSSNSLTQSAALIGRKVAATVANVTVAASGSPPALSVNVTQAALKQPRLVVTDASGNELRSIAVASGQTSVSFDGRSNAGTRLAAGTYNVQLVGTDSAGKPQTAGTVSSSGTVTQVVSQSNGGFRLQLDNGNLVDATSVTSLAQ
jgi:flagellar basal-body rod modification protein FlgD